MPNAKNVAYVAAILHLHMKPLLALIRDSEGESVKLAKRKRIKQLLLTGVGLAFIGGIMVVLFVACPQVAGGG